MGTILVIMSVPFLAATGIYNPQVMHHHRCVAEPGSFDALYCQQAAGRRRIIGTPRSRPGARSRLGVSGKRAAATRRPFPRS